MTLEEIVEEYLDRRRRGEGVSIDAYTAHFPHLAAEIHDTLRALELIEDFFPAQDDPALSTVTATAARLPRQFGDYQILGEIGRGGMGVVYEAEQRSLGRRVALKVLAGVGPESDRARARFHREARAAARLHHTNIVPVFEVGEAGEHTFYAMQLIQGQGLDRVIDDLRRLREQSTALATASPPNRKPVRNDPLAMSLLSGRFELDDLRSTPAPSDPPPPKEPETAQPDPLLTQAAPLPAATLPEGSERSESEHGVGRYYRSVATLGIQAAEALAYAHARGIIHRDVKPSNLLLDAAGVVWLTDFGLAKTEEESLTRTGDILGTVRYMAPEQFDGQADARSDVYSLGLTLYELLTLRHAFDAPDRLLVIEQVRTHEPPRPRSVDRHVPRDLETVVLKAIEKLPRRRYPSAQELAADLRRFCDGEPVRARRITPVERAMKWVRRRPTEAAVYLLLPLVLVLATAGTLATRMWLRSEEARQEADLARGQAEQSRQVAVQERLRAEEALYVNRVRVAHFELQENDIIRTRQLLDGCPQALRDWEWYYLHRLCHADLKTLPAMGRLWNQVLITPDGRRALLSSDAGVYQWRLETASARADPHPFLPKIGCLSLNRAGSRGLGRGPDGSLRVWDLHTGQPLCTLRGPTRSIVAACHSPDDLWLASSDQTGTVHLWDARTGQLHKTFDPLGTKKSSLAFSPDSKLLAVGGPDRIHVHLVDSGKLIHSIAVKHTQVLGISFRSDGKRLCAALHDLSAARIWDTRTWEDVLTVQVTPDTFVWDACFSPDGTRLALALHDRTVRIWNAETGAPEHIFRGHAKGVFKVAFTPDGTQLISQAMDGTVKVWDAVSDPEATILRDDSEITWQAHFSPDGRHLACVGERWFRLIPPRSGAEIWKVMVPKNRPTTLAFRPDGQQIATGNRQGEIVLWDAETGRAVRTIASASSGIRHLSYHPNGQSLLAFTGDGTIDEWDPAAGQRLRGWSLGVEGSEVRYSPDGTRVAACGRGNNGSGVLKIWDAKTGELVLEHSLAQSSGLLCMAFHPNSKRLAVGTRAGWVGVLDALRGEPVAPLLVGHEDWVECVRFTPDGHRLVSGSRDGTVRCWDVEGGREVLILRGDGSWFDELSFSPDGARLAGTAHSFDRPGGIWIWDAPAYPARPARPRSSLPVGP